jgi:hypothetical protein
MKNEKKRFQLSSKRCKKPGARRAASRASLLYPF